MGNFKNLRVWQESIDLCEEIYKLTRNEPFARDYGLKDQIQRAMVSVASNIAEGDERKTLKEAKYFFNISKGSAAEVITQLHIACRVGYLNNDALVRLEDKTEKIRASIKNLIKNRIY